MIEFFQTLGKGIIQGVGQYISNDLEDYIPFFIISALLLIGLQVKKWLKK
jgi:hypothetical protein